MHSKHATRTSCHAFRHGFPSEKKAENGPQTALDASFDPRALSRAPGLRFSGHVGPKLAPFWPHVDPMLGPRAPKSSPRGAQAWSLDGPGAAQERPRAPKRPQGAPRRPPEPDFGPKIKPTWAHVGSVFGSTKDSTSGKLRSGQKGTKDGNTREHTAREDGTGGAQTREHMTRENETSEARTREAETTASKRREAGTRGDKTIKAKSHIGQGTPSGDTGDDASNVPCQPTRFHKLTKGLSSPR